VNAITKSKNHHRLVVAYTNRTHTASHTAASRLYPIHLLASINDESSEESEDESIG